MDLYPVSVQIAFFLATVDFSSKFKIANMVLQKARNVLAAEPILLPLAPDSPREFPQILIRDEKTGWIFQMAPARFDLLISIDREQERGDLAHYIDKAGATVLEIWKGLTSDFAANANRLGFVAAMASELDNAPEVLQQRYLSGSYGKGAYESHIEILHRVEADGFDLNRWVRLRALPEDEKWPPRIAVEVDINTIPEKPIQVTDKTAEKFLSVAKRLTNQSVSDFSAE